MKISEIAQLTGASFEPDKGGIEITGAAGLDIATASQITFLANPKYTPKVRDTKAGAIFVAKETEIENDEIPVLRVDDAYVAFTQTLRSFHPETKAVPGTHPTAIIDPGANVSDQAEICANVVIGKDCVIAAGVRLMPNVTVYERAVIGENTTVHSGAAIREDSVIGKNCIIHNNAVIGSDGFGFAKTPDSKWLKIPQVGHVMIEDDVEIGANSAIDKASVGICRIKRGAKIDNLVQIGHSCTVGEDSLICSQTGLAGSTVVGDRVILAGQVGIAGHLKIGDDVVATAKTGIPNDIEAGTIVSGYPAIENRTWLRSSAEFRRLGGLSRTLRDLEKRISELENEVMKDE